MEAAQCTNYHEAWWAAVPNGQQVMPGPFEARRFDIRQTPAVWLDALTLQMQQTPSPCARMSRPARSGAALPGKRASRGHGSGKDLEVSGLNAWPFVRSKASEPWAPAPPPPPRLPGASVSRGEAERTPTHGLRGAPGPPPALPRRVRTPGTPRRAAPRPHLVDVAVGAAADALNQLEVLLRVPAGQIEAGVHGGPRVHPASLPGRGGGALRGPHGEWEPRPAPGSPGGHNRPAPRCGRRRRSPHTAAATADDDDRAHRPRPPQPAAEPKAPVTPTGRGERSQPLARGETPTWLPPSPLLPLPLLPLLQPPPLVPGLRPDCAAAIPDRALPGLARARRERAAALRRGAAAAGGRDVPDLSLCGQSSGARKGLPSPGTAGGTGRKCSYLLLIPLMTKFDVAKSGPNPKQVEQF